MNIQTTCYHSPIGQIVIKGSEAGIHSVLFSDEPVAHQSLTSASCLKEAVEQLHEYFCHKRQSFNLRLYMDQGTEFQQKVWNSLISIPWGETITYTQLASKISHPHAVRAVGSANGHNPFLVILPCHRVIGTSGVLTGYAGGLLRKKWLLEHEQQSIQLEIF